MEYTPRKEREIRDNMVLNPGEYDFEVVNATEKVSKAGNDMIELQLRIFPGDNSSPRLVKDYLVSGSDFGELKINRFCHATGIQDAYFAGELSAIICEGLAGKCKLTVSSSEQYGNQNQVRDYLPLGFDESSQVAPSTSAAANDELAKFQEDLKAEEADIPF